MSSQQFQARPSDIGPQQFSNDSYHNCNWAKSPSERSQSSHQNLASATNKEVSVDTHENASSQWSTPNSVLAHTQASPALVNDDAWNDSAWTSPAAPTSFSSEQACLMELAKENVLLRRQLHDASVQIHKLTDVLHATSRYSPQPVKQKKIEKINPNQARFWTEEEHQRFVIAIRRYGPKDVKSVSKAVKTRTPVQVRTHAQKYFLKIARDERKKQNSDSTTDGTDRSPSTSSFHYDSLTNMLEDDDDSDEMAVAAATKACSKEGTSAAAAAAFVAANAVKFGVRLIEKEAHHLGPSLVNERSTQPKGGGSGGEERHFFGGPDLHHDDAMLEDPTLNMCGHEAN